MIKKKKVVICWTDISGYMASCWQAMQNSKEIDQFIIAFQAKTETAFSNNLLKEVPSYLLDIDERNDFKKILNLVLEQKPDVIYLPGWFHKPYRKLAFTQQLNSVEFIMGMDTPYWGTFRQKLAPYVLKPYLKRISKVVVSGERSWQYANHLGFSFSQIYRGQYGINHKDLKTVIESKKEKIWPKQFLFLGRYTKVKAIDSLVEAYKSYREMCGDEKPWELICCGQGPLKKLIDDQPGIIDKGFIQPSEVINEMKEAGVMVLPSKFDPWPLVVLESCAAGLPVIATEYCGSTVENVRNLYNGIVVSGDSADELAKAMHAIHNIYYDKLPDWGKRASMMVEGYSAEMWVKKWEDMLLN